MKYLETIETIHRDFPNAKFMIADYMMCVTLENYMGMTIMYLDQFGNLKVQCNNYGTNEDKMKIYNYMEEWAIKLQALQNLR